MGSDETATATSGGPRAIGVFYGNGAPSGPNYLLFSHADRLSDSLWGRSGVGESPTPDARALGAPQRALDPKLGGIMVVVHTLPSTLPICIHRWERPRMRGRRLPTSSTDPRRLPGDLQEPNRIRKKRKKFGLAPRSRQIR